MDLEQASTYFAVTEVSGWDGSAWVPNVSSLTLLPHDRFISEREFGNKRRHALVPPDDTGLQTYPVIRIDTTSEVFLVGVVNYDVQVDPYSQVVLLHRAPFIADLVDYITQTAASGMETDPIRSVSAVVHCDVERVTFSRSQEFDTIKFTETVLTFAGNVAADTGQELVVGSDYYDIQESYLSSGFRQCRAIRKRSA